MKDEIVSAMNTENAKHIDRQRRECNHDERTSVGRLY